jgi:hypothetical protein
MSNVEPETRDFLKKIVLSLFLGLSWLMINMTLGIYIGLLFFEEKPRTANIIFYIFLIITFTFLLRILIRTWKKKYPHG